MIKLVTFKQAIELQKLGFDSDSFEFCFDVVGDMVEIDAYNDNNGEYKIFTVNEALEWFREVKGIPCNVSLDVFEDEYRPLIYQYTGMYWEGYSVFDTDSFDLHSEAESALLDALIEYLS